MMTDSAKLNPNIRPPLVTEALLSLGLFLLALFPRAYDLGRFVTADEAKWVYRSAQFLAAFLQGDWTGTTVNLTPAVTTTWLGSLGLIGYYRLHQATIGLPFEEWLLSLPQFRTELDLVVAARWPMVIVTALAIPPLYWLTRYLFGPKVALIAAIFMALDPHIIALARVLGHDAPVTIFVTFSLLLLLIPFAPTTNLTMIETKRPMLLVGLSGLSAGLAFLSKAPALFLIPFVGLMFVSRMWLQPQEAALWLKRLLLWGLVAYLTFVVVWPAAWLDPIGRPWAVAENAFLSATDRVEAEAEGFWRVPDLGPFYYLVNGGFKLSPGVTLGLGLMIIITLQRRSLRQPSRVNTQFRITKPATGFSAILQSPTLWLTLFILLFILFMTLGGKRSPRYISPIFPALSLVAALGWVGIFGWLGKHFNLSPAKISVGRTALVGSLLLLAAGTLLPYAPYYLTYFNPLLGGAYTAPHLIKIGWGEGLDRVGRFLQREVPHSRVGTAYSSTVAPFFQGDLAGLDSDRLDYVVLYQKQVQGGNAPLLPDVVRYYEQRDPIFFVDLNGIRYANVYPGPAVAPVFGDDDLGQSRIRPVGFRPLTPYARLGETFAVDVVWPSDAPLPQQPVSLTLEPLSVLDNPAATDEAIFATTEADLIRPVPDLVISRHQLAIPADLVARQMYALQVDGQPLGRVEVRNFRVPSNLARVEQNFDNQILLQGYQFEPTEDFIAVTLAWRAIQDHLPDYTVFVQLLDLETDERLAGIDTVPGKGEWPTSQWVNDEVIVDRYLVAVPPGLEAGFFKIIVGLYQPQTGERLQLDDGRDHWLLPWTLIREAE